MKIPKRFKLFATTIEVKWCDRRTADSEAYGYSEYTTSEIMLANNSKGEALSEDRKLDTFYHERTHMILDMMKENELSSNEQFVDVFSKLLRQADESAEY